MSQSSLPRLGFIGAGRLARCLALGFSRAGYPVTAVASRTAASASRLASQIGQCAAFDDPQQVVDAADIVFLAVPDDSIGTSAHTLRFRPHGQALVHCSGASPVELLTPARDQGAAVGGFHPLYLFGGDLADLDRIAGCSVTIEADEPLKGSLTALAVALGCHPLSIPAGGRMLYHAAAHYAASFALCSLAECVALWRTLGFAEDDALRALLPMLAGTIETARDKGLPNALAGPVSRGDTGVVRKQLALLEGFGGDHAALYGLLSRRAVELARRRAAPPAAIEAIAEAVEESLTRSLNAAAAGASVK
ncbi:Rossmann-like and DUF2520 domain-containing protein [Paraburkholderia terricola]|uniref:Short-subunit dehydrogenase-like oxidoreductase (DUF2520 family) n=1 Tax=Paraburkholderia terricola TaxID=169427 RepID=A0ABU1LSG1_9BURK|nr:DUF2520 domain-containing protein [Paraburkholderia terricola]MDR6409692.1 putative short-subunit dehydrogenase-like oxidoreductase (DUF2520 family) [Paraburkholderia terricola]MDR6480584.1 putative short-subunit dehydrogenase-like oxidoreductase (DUF2520 family) [Paraburkholderia terricola]